ncbi:hypothetical protein V1460_27380 [Streptomyces sp. SCSIO 30461]|uniref:hypothetical protein n=1 Tax=Streptomyces sp. SCSIO 30461 TaxID=3118085 RepID=UPI0030D426B4
MRTDRRRSTAPIALAALALTVVAAATGCVQGDEKAADVPKTATGSLEELAAKVSCEPNVSTDAEEIRQANCETKDGTYVLSTFATDRGQREWINEANDYGGTYLVGRRWVVSGDEKVVAALRERLGGDVETGTSHDGHTGGGNGGSGTGDTGGEHSGGEHSGHS